MPLRDVADSHLHALLRLALVDVPAVERHLAARYRKFANNRLHQRGFAGAITAEHGNRAAPGYAEADVEQHLAAAVASIEIANVQKWLFRHDEDRSPGRFCWPEFLQPCLIQALGPDRARSAGHRCHG